MVILHHTVIINESYVCGAFRERVEEGHRPCYQLTPLATYIFTLLGNVSIVVLITLKIMFPGWPPSLEEFSNRALIFLDTADTFAHSLKTG